MKAKQCVEGKLNWKFVKTCICSYRSEWRLRCAIEVWLTKHTNWSLSFQESSYHLVCHTHTHQTVCERPAVWGGDEGHEVHAYWQISDTHSELDFSILHAEVQSGCLQIPITAWVIDQRHKPTQIQLLYILIRKHTHAEQHLKEEFTPKCLSNHDWFFWNRISNVYYFIVDFLKTISPIDKYLKQYVYII